MVLCMNPSDFKKRTKAFALRVVRLVGTVQQSPTGHVIGGQLLRCGTSVGANDRSACRARSRADFVAKMKIVEEECDEALYWMELLVETGSVKAKLLGELMKEADEILAMVVASIKTSRSAERSSIVNRQS